MTSEHQFLAISRATLIAALFSCATSACRDDDSHDESLPDCLEGCGFHDCSYQDLGGIDLSDEYLCGDFNFTGANLSGANLSGQDLSDPIFEEADLSDASLDGMLVEGGLFNYALMDRVSAVNARFWPSFYVDSVNDLTYFKHASMREADLTRASFFGAVLFDADLTGADVDYVDWEACLCPDGTLIETPIGACTIPEG